MITSASLRKRSIGFGHIIFTTILACLLAAFTLAQDDDDEPTSSITQISGPFVDQTTGLPMERFFGARTSFGLAFALPPTLPPAGTSSSFIGQLTFPLVDGQGWGAMGLTGDMEGNFILAIWPDGNGGVMASFRQATNEDNPPEVTGAFNVRPLPDGAVVNATALSYTFLCENCIDASLGLVQATGGNAVMGWALSERPPRGSPANPGAFLGFHERGFGPFTARLGAAATQQFDAVAATALQPVPASRNARAAVAGTAGAESDDDDDDDQQVNKGGDGDGGDDDDD